MIMLTIIKKINYDIIMFTIMLLIIVNDEPYLFHGVYTVCPGRSDPFCIVTYYIEWVTTSWTYSISKIIITLSHSLFLYFSFFLSISLFHTLSQSLSLSLSQSLSLSLNLSLIISLSLSQNDNDEDKLDNDDLSLFQLKVAKDRKKGDKIINDR